MAFAAIDVAGVFEYFGVVGQRAPGDSQLGAGAPVVAEAVVVVISQREVGFASIRLEAQSGLHGRIGQIETGGSVVVALKIDIAMHLGQQAPGEQEVRVAGDSFIEQARGLGQLLLGVDLIRGVGVERLGPQVKVVGGKIGRGRFLDRSFFARRELGLKLVGDRFGNLALNGENIRQSRS